MASTLPLTSALEQGLREALPPSLDEAVPQLAQLLADVAAGTLTARSAEERLARERLLVEALRSLSGTTLTADTKVLHISDEQITIGDIHNAQGVAIGRGAIAVSLTVAAEQAYEVAGLPTPFLGLHSFTYKERERFAGRDAVIRHAVEKLTLQRPAPSLLFVTGASGSGKSSFVQAGLVPALEEHYSRRHKDVRQAVITPGRYPMSALANALEQLKLPPDEVFLEARPFLVGVPAEPPPPDSVCLLVIDQFEELFSPECEGSQCQVFLAILARLPLFPALRMHMIATLRADFLPSLFQHPALYDIAKHGIDLRQMSKDELRDAIQHPIWQMYPEKRLEPALLDVLVDDACADATYLPLLQVTLDELWRRGSLRRGAYASLADAIGKRAEEVYSYRDFDGERKYARPAEEQDQIMQILLGLVSVSPDDDKRHDVRRRRTMAELVDGHPERVALITALATGRLISTGREWRGQSELLIVDLIHEALMTRWRRLAEAIDTSREQLQRGTRFRQALSNWVHEKENPAYLLEGVHLSEAEELERQGELQEPSARQFLQRSRERRDAAQQRELEQARRRQRRLIGLVLLLLVSFAVAVGLGLYANDQQRHAEFQQKQAEFQRLVGLAQRFRSQGQDDLAVAAAVEASKSPSARSSDSSLQEMFGQVVFSDAGTRHLFQHEGEVTSVVFSPVGGMLLSGSLDQSAMLWDVASGELLDQFTEHQVGVTSLAFLPNGRYALLGYADGTLIEAEVSREGGFFNARPLEGERHQGAVNSIAVSADGTMALTGSSDQTVMLWSLVAGTSIWQAAGHTARVNTVAFIPNADEVVSGGEDNLLCRWQLTSGAAIECINVQEKLGSASYGVKSIAVSAMGDQLLVGRGGFDLGTYTRSTGTLTLWPRVQQGAGLSVAVSPDGLYALSGSTDTTANLWRLEPAGEVKSLFSYTGHMGPVNSVAFAPDGTLIATGSADKTVRIWELSPPSQARVWGPVIPGGGTDCAVIPPPTNSGQAQSRLVSNAVTGAAMGQLLPESNLWRLQLSPDKRMAVSYFLNEPLKLWDLETDTVRALEQVHLGWVSSVSFSRDGRFFVSTSYPGTNGPVLPGNQRNDMLVVWDAATGEPLHHFTTSASVIRGAVFNPTDNQQILSASDDGTLTLWNVATGDVVRRLEGHFGPVKAVAFLPDGRRAVSGSDDTSLILWDLDTGQQLARMRGYALGVEAVTVTSDGKYSLSGSWDGTIIRWDLETYRPVQHYVGHTSRILHLQMCGDAQHFLSDSWDDTVRLWTLMPPDDLVQWTIEHRYIPVLTPEERKQYGIDL